MTPLEPRAERCLVERDARAGGHRLFAAVARALTDEGADLDLRVNCVAAIKRSADRTAARKALAPLCEHPALGRAASRALASLPAARSGARAPKRS